MQGELLNARLASAKYNLYVKYFELIKYRINDQEFKEILPEMDKVATQVYINFTRINCLAYPSDTKMEQVEVE